MTGDRVLRAAVLIAAALAFGATVCTSYPALAIGANEALPDPLQETRARALFKELRCLVCQNQSIDDSEADLARDIRIIVRERIQAGESDDAIRQFLTARYGDFVLLNPPVETRTWLLWFGPFALLAVAGIAIAAAAHRRRHGTGPPQPLTAEERARLEHLLDGKDDKP